MAHMPHGWSVTGQCWKPNVGLQGPFCTIHTGKAQYIGATKMAKHISPFQRKQLSQREFRMSGNNLTIIPLDFIYVSKQNCAKLPKASPSLEVDLQVFYLELPTTVTNGETSGVAKEEPGGNCPGLHTAGVVVPEPLNRDFHKN